MFGHRFLRVLASWALLLVIAIILFSTGPALVPAAIGPKNVAPTAPAAPAAEPATPAEAAAIAVPAPTPPGVHVAKAGESVGAVARQYLPQSAIMTLDEFEHALRDANHIQGTFLRKGQQLVVPGFESEPIVERPVPVPRDYEVRAIYLTGLMAGSDHGVRLIRRWRQAGGNAVVFDIKDSDGSVKIFFEHPLAPVRNHPPIRNLGKFVRFLHGQGMRAIARIALFRDESLVSRHPDLAVRSRRNAAPWRETGKLVWTDPSHPEVQQYNLALANHVAESGVDEVQFDYVRFPAEGDQPDARFAFETAHPQWKRSDVITDFLARAYAGLRTRGVVLSLDVFGVMAWQRPIDLAHTGQDIPAMARNCDVLSPMIYPSHFFGMDGFAKPGDAPEHFISESMEKFQKITAGSGVVLRPWLQAFAWHTRSYSTDYILTQVSTAKEKGGVGFLFWNASNDYSKPLAAMPEMRAAHGRFFRGDELKTASAPAPRPPAGSL